MELDVNPFWIQWYRSFLSYSSQQVKFNSVLSNLSISSTGAPEGCVSSPFHLILYTNECVSSQPNQRVIKYPNDTVTLRLLTGNSRSQKVAVDEFVDLCNTHRSYINTSKRVAFIWSIGDSSPGLIHGNIIQQVPRCANRLCAHLAHPCNSCMAGKFHHIWWHAYTFQGVFTPELQQGVQGPSAEAQSSETLLCSNINRVN